MLQTLGIVEVTRPHPSSARLTTSLAERAFAGKSLLEWIVRRMTEATHLDRIVIVIDETDRRAELARRMPPDVLIHANAPVCPPVRRLAEVVRTYDARSAIRVKLDHPFIDPVLLDQLAITARDNPQCDYIGYCSSRGRSALTAQVGMCAEWFRRTAIFRAVELANRPSDGEDLGRFLCSRPESFRIRLVPIPEQLDREDVRLQIGGEEDWEHAMMILDALGPDNLDWQRIAKLLETQPALRQRMATLNQGDACSA